MKNKKQILAFLLALLFVLSTLTACGEKAPESPAVPAGQTEENPAATADEDTEKEPTEDSGKEFDEPSTENLIGMLRPLGLTDEEEAASPAHGNTLYFDELAPMLLALDAGKIRQINTLPEAVTQYIAMRNERYVSEHVDGRFGGTVELCMGTLEESEDIFSLLSDAVESLLADGTVDRLIEEYVVAFVSSGEEPEPTEMPYYDGLETIRVAITGDMPPIDYITADGRPAGFNVAFLAEVSRRANVNFELVQVSSGARLMALTSGMVDAVFCFSGYRYEDPELQAMNDADIADGVALTPAYYSSDKGRLHLK